MGNEKARFVKNSSEKYSLYTETDVPACSPDWPTAITCSRCKRAAAIRFDEFEKIEGKDIVCELCLNANEIISAND